MCRRGRVCCEVCSDGFLSRNGVLSPCRRILARQDHVARFGSLEMESDLDIFRNILAIGVLDSTIEGCRSDRQRHGALLLRLVAHRRAMRSASSGRETFSRRKRKRSVRGTSALPTRTKTSPPISTRPNGAVTGISFSLGIPSALSIMTVFLLEMFQRTGLKGYDCSGWRLRKVTRTQKKSYSEPRARVSIAKVGCLARRGWQVKRVSA